MHSYSHLPTSINELYFQNNHSIDAVNTNTCSILVLFQIIRLTTIS